MADRDGVEHRLAHLEQLAKELVSSRAAIESHFQKGGKQVADAISHLATAFDQSTRHGGDEARNQSGSYPSFTNSFDSTLKTAKQVKGDLPRLPQIADVSLEKAVFTHQGFALEKTQSTTSEMSYDRLEILGDAYIEVIATRLIWHHFRYLTPGRISQLRELLVKNETLAEYATSYGFDRRVSVPPDHRDQPKLWIKIKGDVFEAYVAAVILSNPDDGFQRVEAWLQELWSPKLAEAQPTTRHCFPKQELAKRVMRQGVKIEYTEERPSVSLGGGLDKFFVGAYLTGWGWKNQHLGSGEGQSKTEAGNNAASQALENRPLIDEIALAKKTFDQSIAVKKIQPKESETSAA